MAISTDKLQFIYNQLFSLLSQLRNINVKNFSSLSKQIEEMVIGENKINSWINKSIQEITEDDLKEVTSIGNYAFTQCSNLSNITIPNSVTSIGEDAFRQCSNLTSVIIPNSVTSIGKDAFNQCSNLTSVIIPDSVTSIGEYAFNQCSNLIDIYLSPITPPSLGNAYTIPNETTIHVHVGSGDAYKSATNWSYYSARIVEDIQPS